MPDIHLKAVSVDGSSVALEPDGSRLWIGTFREAKLSLSVEAEQSVVPWEAEWGTLGGYGKSPQDAVDSMVEDARKQLAEVKRLLDPQSPTVSGESFSVTPSPIPGAAAITSFPGESKMHDLESMSRNLLRWGVESDDTAALQSSMVYLGYGLTKYGTDGFLGRELEGAVESFCADHGMDDAEGVWVPTDEDGPWKMDLSGVFAAMVCQMADDVEGVRQRYNVTSVVGASPSKVHGYRTWLDIDSIVLHQTGVFMTDTPRRFERLRAHIGVLRDGELFHNPVTGKDGRGDCVVQVHELDAYLWHANGLNAQSVGIEVNGKFDGVHGGERPDPPQHQIANARVAVRFTCDMIGAHGGQVRNILPHRVSSMTRRSDPGEAIWKGVGRWAQDELGLSDGGPGFVSGGRPIPEAWDPRYLGEKY